AMDPLYAKQIGVDIDELLVSQPDYGEQALEIADMLVRSGAVDVVAIDSVAALTPRAELEGQMGDQTVGAQARMMSQAMRKLAGNLNRTQTLCILTNQIREKVGVMFGSPVTPPGGRGRPNAKAHLDANPAMAKEIEEKIYAALGLSKDAVTPIERDGEARPPLASEPAAPPAARAA